HLGKQRLQIRTRRVKGQIPYEQLLPHDLAPSPSPPGTDESRRNCKGREADGVNDAAESRTDKGTGLSYVESAAAASGPLGGVRCGSDGVRWGHRRALRGAAARHAVPRSTATILGEGPDRFRSPLAGAGATQRFQPCARQPRAVPRVLG